MRQACSHPSLVAGKTADDAEALDPTPQKESISSTVSSATATPRREVASDDLDSLIGTLGALSVGVKSDGPPKVCALCPKNVRRETDAYCDTCENEMGQFGTLELSTKIRQTIHILEGIRKELGHKKTIIFSQVRCSRCHLCSIR